MRQTAHYGTAEAYRVTQTEDGTVSTTDAVTGAITAFHEEHGVARNRVRACIGGQTEPSDNVVIVCYAADGGETDE